MARSDPSVKGLSAEQVYNLIRQEEKQLLQEEQQAAGDGACQQQDSRDGSDGTPQKTGSHTDGGSGSTASRQTDDCSSVSADGLSIHAPPINNAHVPNAHGDPGGCGEVIDAAPSTQPAEIAEVAEEWQVYTRQAASIARRYGEGRVPGFVEEIIDTLNEPQVDWRAVLRRFVDPLSATKDYSWSIPNRRHWPAGYLTPGQRSDGIHKVALCIDTSESVDSYWLSRFGAECQDALDAGAIDEVVLIFADTKVQRVAHYVQGEEIDFTCVGRGGTRFAPTFEWMLDNEPDVQCAVYFTDLESTHFGPEPPFPVLWANYGRDRGYPWGECVRLED